MGRGAIDDPAHDELFDRHDDGSRFRAFLSYSHIDGTIARRLHRKLESYRLPKNLRSDEVVHTDQGRLGQIFRDRDDFPAAADLSESVKRALANSDALIVLCSPEAKESPWVAREIELFRELHPDRPILAALIRGKPAKSFPKELTALGEPLAADFRPNKDGEKLGLLKLVAGLADVPLDALVQRDSQRYVRRVTGVTVASLLSVLVLAGMTYLALDQRNEARDQRAEAEALIEYMLTDLRGDLRTVGRLDVMTDVNERAMAYYEGQGDLSRLPVESLERRARILHAMGEDDTNRGDLELARAKFVEAHRTTAEILARDPANADRIFAQAQSEYWLGYVAYLEQEWTRAGRYWRDYKRLADRLVAADPDDPNWVRELGYAEGNLCTLALAQENRVAESLRHCRAALAAMQQVRSRLPEDRGVTQDVANSHAWLADAWLARDDRERAVTERRAHELILEDLIQQYPNDLHLQDQWMRSLMTSAEWARDSGNVDDALNYQTQARAVADRLLRHDPANDRWQTWSRRIDNVMQ